MNARIIAVLFLAVLVAGCGGIEPKKEVVSPITNIGGELQVQWTQTSLSAAGTQRSFSIEDYQQPVLVNVFTTWCDSCVQQHENLEEADAAYVALSVDPQDDLVAYVSNNAFSAPFASADEQLTNKLVDEFGVGVLNPLSNPTILVCPNGDSTLLPSGLKSVEALENAVSSC